MKSSVKSFKSSIILITITIFDIDVITILLQYLFSQKTHNNNTAQSAHPTQPEYRGSVCECGGTQRTPSLSWADTLNTRYRS